MNGFQLFALVFFAGIGTLVFIETILTPPDKIDDMNLFTALYALLQFVFMFIIEPLAVLNSLKNNIGNIVITYLILGVVAINIYTMFEGMMYVLLKNVEINRYENRIMTENEVYEFVTSKKSKNIFVRKAKQIILQSPKIYLWYLVLISVNLIL